LGGVGFIRKLGVRFGVGILGAVGFLRTLGVVLDCLSDSDSGRPVESFVTSHS